MQGIYSGTVTLLFCWNKAFFFFFYCYKNSHLQKGKKYLHKSVLSLAFSNPSLSIKCNTNISNTSQKGACTPCSWKCSYIWWQFNIFKIRMQTCSHSRDSRHSHAFYTYKKNKKTKLVTLTATWDTNLTLNRGFLKKNSIVHFCCSPH